MLIGNRLRELRETKQLSQGDIEKRTGLLRCYISRVENRHTVPAIETLEKMARALEVPMYRLFHDGEVPAGLSKLKPPKDDEFGSRGREADYFSKLRMPKRLLGTPCRTGHRSESWAIPSLCRATPSATSEHSMELLGSSPIPRSFVASCVSFQLRLLPFTGVTRLRQYYEPLRHPSQP